MTTHSFFIIVLVLFLFGCKSPVGNQTGNDVRGRWEGHIDAYPIQMNIETSNVSLSGDVSWTVGNPTYITVIGSESYVMTDSVFLNLRSTIDDSLLAVLQGQISGGTMTGIYEKRDANLPLSQQGTWQVAKAQ